MINKNAGRVGVLQWKGQTNTLTLYLGTNSNTGEDILWQVVSNWRATRVTGRNLVKIVKELDHALNEGEIVWLTKDDIVLNQLRRHLS